MIILGIDPALNKTGYGVIELMQDNSMKYLTSGIIKIDGSKTMIEKLSILNQEFKKIIKKWQPEHIAIEDIFINKNPMTSLKLGQARGAIITSCLEHNEINNEKFIFEYAPNLIKKSIVGVGRAEKSQVAMMVKILLSIKEELRYDDESDALAVAICHINHFNNRLLWQAMA